jgi:hypothetical protein
MKPLFHAEQPVRGPMAWAVLTVAVVLGLGSAWAAVKGLAGWGGTAGAEVAVGPWRASTLTGSTDADLYTRARVAVGGLLALNRSETMYYVAQTDSAGRPLRSRCTYRVAGRAPSARWWSVTAYADDLFLFDNPRKRYSLNGSQAVLDAQGQFSLVSAPVEPAGQAAVWLPTPGDRGLVFTLRLYNPAPELVREPARLQAPRIERVGDCA